MYMLLHEVFFAGSGPAFLPPSVSLDISTLNTKSTTEIKYNSSVHSITTNCTANTVLLYHCSYTILPLLLQQCCSYTMYMRAGRDMQPD